MQVNYGTSRRQAAPVIAFRGVKKKTSLSSLFDDGAALGGKRIEERKLTTIDGVGAHQQQVEQQEQRPPPLQRVLNSLSDENGKTRRAALLSLQSHYISHTDSLPLLMKPLLKRFSDSSSSCRELAASLVLRILRAAPSVSPWLGYVVPVLLTRLGGQLQQGAKQTEEEEIRLLLVEILSECCGSRVEIDAIYPHIGYICSLLVLGCRDTFPQVLIVSLSSVHLLCTRYPQLMRAHSPAVMTSLLPLLAFKHVKVRVLAVQAVRDLVACGASEGIRDLAGFREHNMIDLNEFYHGGVRANYMGTLVIDDKRTVREAFYDMLIDWMANLPERFDYETLIMPYLLSGLFDSEPSICERTRDAIESMGRLYEEENEVELHDQLLYGVEAERKAYPGVYDDGVLLFPPFTARPCLGARLIIARFVPRLIKAILNELGDWKSKTRIKSFSLLRVLQTYHEVHMTKYCERLLVAFHRCSVDATVSEELGQCVQLLARYSPATDLIDAFEAIEAGMQDLRTLVLLHVALSAVPTANLPVGRVCALLLEQRQGKHVDFETHTALLAAICLELGRHTEGGKKGEEEDGEEKEEEASPPLEVLCLQMLRQRAFPKRSLLRALEATDTNAARRVLEHWQ